MMMRLIRFVGQIERPVIFSTQAQMTALLRFGIEERLVQALDLQVCLLGIRRESLMLRAKAMDSILLLMEKTNFLRFGTLEKWLTIVPSEIVLRLDRLLVSTIG